LDRLSIMAARDVLDRNAFRAGDLDGGQGGEPLNVTVTFVRPGDEAQIDEWGGDHPLAGRVRLIEPSAFTRVSALGVEEKRVNVIVDILNPPSTLGDGFQVEVKTVVWSSPDVLTIPSSSVFQRSGAWAVFVVEDGRARFRKVVIGHRTGATAELLQGVKAGERVIMFPSDKIDDGSRVR